MAAPRTLTLREDIALAAMTAFIAGNYGAADAAYANYSRVRNEVIKASFDYADEFLQYSAANPEN